MAWALLQMLDRHPDQPDVDVVFNCRDGPLLRRTHLAVRGMRLDADAAALFELASASVALLVLSPRLRLLDLSRHALGDTCAPPLAVLRSRTALPKKMAGTLCADRRLP